MMRIHLPVEQSNNAVKDGSLPKLMGKMIDQLKPEAAYFFPDDGLRSALFVFDLKDPSQIPMVAEPFFEILHAEVTLTPVMNADDLKAGLAKIMNS
jgi:hypothetical protein